MNHLKDLFIDQLADMYDAEKRILKALKKLAKNAEAEELKEAFEEHAGETEEQITNLEKVFELFDEKAKGKACKATIGLLEEGDEIAEEHGDTPAGDAALIAAAQKVEHYEIGTYGCLVEWARLLENDEAVDVLQGILDQEEAADEKLSGLSEEANAKALAGGEDEEGEGEEDEEDAPKKAKKK
ncbi:MAG: DUF892 family protein [Nibricoccus sp.]